uniref:Uncharacterized protein n=1 Tax=Anguilla anguilla TaxID=7936 RepID=A0A0E9QT84_ANGAN
MGAGGQGLRD